MKSVLIVAILIFISIYFLFDDRTWYPANLGVKLKSPADSAIITSCDIEYPTAAEMKFIEEDKINKFDLYCHKMCENNKKCLGYYSYGSNGADATCAFRNVCAGSSNLDSPEKIKTYYQFAAPNGNDIYNNYVSIPDDNMRQLTKAACPPVHTSSAELYARYDPILGRCMYYGADLPADLITMNLNSNSNNYKNIFYSLSGSDKVLSVQNTNMTVAAEPPIRLNCDNGLQLEIKKSMEESLANYSPWSLNYNEEKINITSGGKITQCEVAAATN